MERQRREERQTVLILIELTDWETIEKGYAVYRDCMYLPTKEKYQQKMQAYLQDAAIKIYGCFCENALKDHPPYCAMIYAAKDSNSLSFRTHAIQQTMHADLSQPDRPEPIFMCTFRIHVFSMKIWIIRYKRPRLFCYHNIIANYILYFNNIK